MVILITLVASFLSWHASLTLKRNSYVTGTHQNRTLSVGYSLGMVKMEAFEDSHFMPLAVRSGHTNHTGSIVSLMACISDLKKKFLCNRNSSKSYSVCGLQPWYGENESV